MVTLKKVWQFFNPAAEAKKKGIKIYDAPVLISPLSLPVAASKNILSKIGSTITSFLPKSNLGKLKLAVATPVIAGAVSSSSKVQETLKKVFNPVEQFKKGKEIGALIEDPSKLLPKDQSLGEKVKDVAKTAGLGAAAAAATVGAVAAGKKVVEKIKAVKAPAVSLAAQPESVLPTFETIGTAQKEVAVEETTTTPTMPSINNKITFKPQINIKVQQNRKFINQHNVIRR